MLGDAIRQARIESGMSQEQLAERLGVSRQSISLWETNQTRPTAENIISIAKILGVSTDDLLLDENKIWSKSSYRDLEEPDGEQRTGNPLNKKYIAIIALLAALILLIGICMGFLIGRGRNKDTSPTETQSEIINEKESTDKEDKEEKDTNEAEKDESESEENGDNTNGQTSYNNYTASTQSSTQGKEKTTEKQAEKKDSSTEKTTKATTTAKKEYTAEEVAKIINNATGKIINDNVDYSLTRTCNLTELSIPSKDTLNRIANGVSEGETVESVIGKILNTGTYSESVYGGTAPSNPTYALKASNIRGEDITSFEVSGNTYTLYLRNSSTPVRTGNTPLSRMTNNFITKEDINSYIKSIISSISVTDYSSENTDIKVTAKINGKKLNELVISYNTASTVNLKALTIHITGKVNYNTSIRYYGFNF